MKKATIAMLCCVLILTSSCQQGTRPTTPDHLAAVGRYVEQPLSAPEGIREIISLNKLDDNSVWLVGQTADGPTIWSTTDLGLSWQEERFPWWDELADSPTSAYVVSAEEIYMLCTLSEGFSDNADLTVNTNDLFYKADRESIEQLDSAAFASTEMLYNIRDIRVSKQGDLLIKSASAVTQMQALSGRVKNSFDVDIGALFGGVAARGNYLFAAAEGTLRYFDLEAGAELGSIDIGAPIPMGQGYSYTGANITAVDYTPQDQMLYFANMSGLYRVALDGVSPELLLDGDLTSLCLPTNRIRYLFADDEQNFLAVTRDGAQNKFYRYTFDPDMTVPTQSLKVFSLEENRTVRQAIGQIHQERPELKISYEVALASGGAITASDAMRSLSYEMLSGNGPDVLVLDGMSVERFIELDILSELSPHFADMIASQDMLPIAGAYGRGDKLFAVPGRFRVPMMQNRDGIAFEDLESLVDWLENQDLREVGAAPERLMARMYPYLSAQWFTSDNTFDGQRFGDDLALLGRIADMHTPYSEEDALYREPYNLGAVSGGIQAGSYYVAFGTATSFQWPSASQVAIDAGYAGPLMLFPGGGVFIPGTILGVNKASDQLDAAHYFVEYTLSEQVLAYDLNDGFATHVPSLIASSGSVLPTETVTSNGRYFDVLANEWVTITREYSWLSEEQIADYIELFRTIETPSHTEMVIMEMLIADTQDYLQGAKSLEDTVASVQEKMFIYLSQ